MTEIRRVGFIGLGTMGRAMAENLRKKGFALSVWNRSPGRAAELKSRGAEVADSPRALASSVDAVCLSLSDAAACEAVLQGDSGVLAGAEAGSKAGAMLCNFSTVSPEQSRALAQAVAAKKVAYVECPVSGSQGPAQQGTLLVLGGGDEAELSRAEPLFRAVGEKWIRCGRVGDASAVKLAVNSMLAAMLESLSEGMRLVRKAGVEPQVLLSAVQSAAVRSPLYEGKGKVILARDFSPTFSVDLLAKDLGLAAALAKQVGDSPALLPVLQQVYAEARKEGRGGLDIAAATLIDDGSRSR